MADATALYSIPGPLRAIALVAGLQEASIDRAWTKFRAWHYRVHGTQEFRVEDWKREIDYALRDAKKNALVEQTTKALSASAAQRRAQEQAADDAYRAAAVSYDDWLATMPEDHPQRRHRATLPSLGPLTVLRDYAEQEAKRLGPRSRDVAILDDRQRVVGRRAV